MGERHLCRTTEAAYRRAKLKDDTSKGKQIWMKIEI